MIKLEGKFRTKIKRYLLDFEEDEEQITRDKNKRREALERLRRQARPRSRG